jgi:hypothetical protein
MERIDLLLTGIGSLVTPQGNRSSLQGVKLQ